MASRNVRWLALALFALANLICWVGVAAGISLAVSQSLNLGMEALIREGQATVVALWEGIGQEASDPAVKPEQGAIPAPGVTEGVGDEPMAAILSPGGIAAVNTPQPDTTSVADAGSSPDSQPTPQPEPTLVSEPLLLADPEINNLTLLDTEMALSASGRPVQIRYQEDALNAEIEALWQNNPDLPFRDVKVDLMRDQVVITGKVTVLGFGISAEVTGEITAQDCVPVLEIAQIDLAGVMTPKFVRDQVEDMMLEAMTWYPADYPLCVQQIVLEETRATLYGYRR